MAVLHQISALKQAGFTLEEIVRINSGEDEEALLLKKKSELLSKIAEFTKQVAVLEGYLAKKKAYLLSPVLIKEVPECKVACIKTRLDSYDNLFEKMPQMGEFMEQAGCICARPEYCFTNYLEPSYKEEDILVELCEAVTECKDDVGELHFKMMLKIQAESVLRKGKNNN